MKYNLIKSFKPSVANIMLAVVLLSLSFLCYVFAGFLWDRVGFWIIIIGFIPGLVFETPSNLLQDMFGIEFNPFDPSSYSFIAVTLQIIWVYFLACLALYLFSSNDKQNIKEQNKPQ